jgi:hypothetical protein
MTPAEAARFMFIALWTEEIRIMQSGTSVVVWIYDEAAKLILGLDRPEEEESRWAILGTVDREQEGVGIWLAIVRLEERRGNIVTKVWMIQPEVCLIRWDFIITAQRLEGETGERKIEGFQPLTE